MRHFIRGSTSWRANSKRWKGRRGYSCCLFHVPSTSYPGKLSDYTNPVLNWAIQGKNPFELANIRCKPHLCLYFICNNTNRLLSCSGRVGAEFSLCMNFLVKSKTGSAFSQALCLWSPWSLFVQGPPSESKTCILPFPVWVCFFLLSSSECPKTVK